MIKNQSLLALGMALFGLWGSPSQAAVSSGQAREILRAIDDACQDKWCDSQYNFHFNGFVCDPDTKICKIVFSIEPSVQKPSKIVGEGFHLMFKGSLAVGSCTFNGVGSAEDMMGVKLGLTEKFFSQVDSCLNAAIVEASRQK